MDLKYAAFQVFIVGFAVSLTTKWIARRRKRRNTSHGSTTVKLVDSKLYIREDKIYWLGLLLGLAIFEIALFTTDGKNVLEAGGYAGIGIILAMISLLITSRAKRK